jgi:hypothetical protein
VKSTIPYSRGLPVLLETLNQKPSRLGKKPEELKFKWENEKIILSYDFNKMRDNLAVKTEVGFSENKNQLKLTTSYLLFTPLSISIFILSIVGVITIWIFNKGPKNILELLHSGENSFMFYGFPIVLLIMAIQFHVNLSGIHKTSIRLIKRGIAISNEK